MPDVVVSDIGLPDADGHGPIRRLRALDVPAAPTVVAVALTGWARPEDRDEALEAGFRAPLELVTLLVPGPARAVGTGFAQS